MKKQIVICGSVVSVEADFARVQITLGSECRMETGERLPGIVHIRGDYHCKPVLDITGKYNVELTGEITRPRFVKVKDVVLLVRNDRHSNLAWRWCYAEEAEKAKLPEPPIKLEPKPEPKAKVEAKVQPKVEPTPIVSVAVAVETVKPGSIVRNGHTLVGAGHPSKYTDRKKRRSAVEDVKDIDQAVAATV